jgi:hypothetical protein
MAMAIPFVLGAYIAGAFASKWPLCTTFIGMWEWLSGREK